MSILTDQQEFTSKSSTELKLDYFNKTLQIYKNKCKQLYEQNQELLKENIRLNQEFQSKQKQVAGLHGELASLKNLCLEATQQKHRISTDLRQKKRVIEKSEQLSENHKIAMEEQEKLSCFLTKEIEQLKKNKIELTIQLQQEYETKTSLINDLDSKDKQILLLSQLNENLKIQVEELLLEMKVNQRRKDTQNLMDYEEKMETRMTEKEDGQIVGLLQEKVNRLEKKLFQTNQKYKNLQRILYNG